MKKLLKNCVFVIAMAGLLGIMAGTAMAAMPGNGAAQMQKQLNEAPAGLNGYEDVQDFEYRLANCVISGECDVEPVGDPAPADEYPVEPDDPADDDGGSELGDPPVNPENPGITRIPDTPEVTTEETPDEPPVITQEVPPPTRSSKLPNTGSSLALLAGMGALLMACAFGARMLVARRAG